MLCNKYDKKFINKINANATTKNTIDKIIMFSNKINKDCIDWGSNEVLTFLKNIKTVSPNTINRSYNILREFVRFICEKEDLPAPEEEMEIPIRTSLNLVDWDTLLAETITPWDYMSIKNQLDTNIRDKVTFELAWNLLTSDEIKHLKESDISFIENPDNGLDIAYLNISETKVVKIEDPEIVDDIKQCMREQYYYSETRNGVLKRYPFKNSEYLIKPTTVGKNKNKDETLSNPSESMKQAFIKHEITCQGIDLTELNIEAVRRSRLVYLMSKDNEQHFDMDFITTLLDAGNIGSTLYWLKEVSKRKYNN